MENINFNLLGFDIKMTNMFACVALPANQSVWARSGPWGDDQRALRRLQLEGQGPEDRPEKSQHQRGDQADSKQPIQPRWGGGQPEPTQSKFEVEICFGQNWNHCKFLFLELGGFFGCLPAEKEDHVSLGRVGGQPALHGKSLKIFWGSPWEHSKGKIGTFWGG